MARLIDAVIGHTQVWENLIRQMRAGHLPHAMAFAGPSGIGKKRVAWAFAQALVCEREERPCGECPACRRIENQQSESLLFLEPEKGTIKLDSTHQILQFLTLQRIGRARVIIIDSAQTMNPQATNALLKVLEEPPPETYFILVVSELSQLLPTLRSRVQVLRFSPLTEAQIQGAEPAPGWMVRSARGSFEQLAAFRDETSEEIRALVMDFINGALAGRREGLDALLDRTKDREVALSAIHFIQQLLRDWAILDTGEAIHSDLAPKLQALRPLSDGKKIELWRRAFQIEQDFKAHVDRALLFENFYYGMKSAQ
ncbi:MAG: DNA polymerase III subunit [Bdellovibrionales bacterium]